MAKWVCSVCGYVYEGDNPPAECPVCHGKGKIKSSILFVDTLERKIERLVDIGIKRFTLYVHPYVYAYIDKGIWSIKRQWMWKYVGSSWQSVNAE